MGECTFWPRYTYADLDKHTPGAGLRLWMHHHGQKAYQPNETAGHGAAIQLGESQSNNSLQQEIALDDLGLSS